LAWLPAGRGRILWTSLFRKSLKFILEFSPWDHWFIGFGLVKNDEDLFHLIYMTNSFTWDDLEFHPA
jgi:hypothetical protein